jgi:hypothetical protein
MLEDLLFQGNLRSEILMEEPLDLNTRCKDRARDAIAQNQVLHLHLKVHLYWILRLACYHASRVDQVLAILENLLNVLAQAIVLVNL